ncbi:hypothetical protein TrVE_jg3065 [Triparma verrucosa]|uniref:RING-type domain-containing protein n=1 Tax=Triparma verrucosa TaxID=1606542 RepID=A0A9W6Z2W4_9STRA|nr:hypothetical protein TrVE_jg3065 [Triparma verrucosa]
MLPLHEVTLSPAPATPAPTLDTPSATTIENFTTLSLFNLLFTLFFRSSYTRLLDSILNLLFIPLGFYFLTLTCLRLILLHPNPNHPNRPNTNLINAHLAQRQQLLSMLSSSSSSARRFARTVVRDEEFTGDDMGDLEENLSDQIVEKCDESTVLALSVKRLGVEGESCVICTEELMDKDVLEIKCGHFACYECQLKWLKEKGKCSVCMVELLE